MFITHFQTTRKPFYGQNMERNQNNKNCEIKKC